CAGHRAIHPSPDRRPPSRSARVSARMPAALRRVGVRLAPLVRQPFDVATVKQTYAARGLDGRQGTPALPLSNGLRRDIEDTGCFSGENRIDNRLVCVHRGPYGGGTTMHRLFSRPCSAVFGSLFGLTGRQARGGA